MSFLPSEIARLVLGYLEETKCCDAYDIFFNTCPYLDECLKVKKDGRKFKTQVMGLTLLEILHEYCAIDSLVQERLKKVDPETAESLKKSGNLVDKITFLINATSSGQTMLFSITLPPGKSPQTSTVAHVRKRLKTAPAAERRKESKKVSQQVAEALTYPETFECGAGPATVETTSLSSLPGNSIGANGRTLDSCDQAPEDITRTPKRKLAHKRKSRSNSEEGDENLDISIITKALLDNHELHEKIAENINKVICTPELNASTLVPAPQDLAFLHNSAVTESNNFTMELDNVIKKIVQQTESDPVFEHLLQDVAGPLAEETSDDCDDRGISDTSTPYQSTPEINKKQLLKNRLRSSKLKRTESPLTSSSELNTPNKIDHQNAAAIESIVLMNTNLQQENSADCNVTVIENSKANDPRAQETDLIITCTPATDATVTVAAKESTVETIMQPITVLTTPALPANGAESVGSGVPSDGNFNPSLLMVSQQNAIPSQSAIVITETFSQQPLFHDNKIIFLTNKVGGLLPQYLTVQPTQLQQLTQPTVISNSDVLNMPTMIMCGDELQKSYMPATVPSNSKPCAGTNVPIQPKGPLPEPSMSFKDCPETNRVLKPKPTKRKKAVSTPTCEIESSKLSTSAEVETQPATESQPVPDTVPQSCSASVSVAPSVPVINLDSGTKQGAEEPPKSVTPNKTSVQVNLTTPRNGLSHVRALDFSTPPKDNSSGRKTMSSPTARGSRSKSPKTVPTGVRTNLFPAPIQIVNIPIATRSPMAKLTGGWDQVQGAGTILGKQKSPPKTRNSLSDSDIVVRPRTKGKMCEKIERPRRAVSLKVKRKDAGEETRTTTEEPNKASANDSSESLDMDADEIGERMGEKESTVGKTRKKPSWDEDLRALVQPVSAVPKRKVTATKRNLSKRLTKSPRKKTKTKAVDMNKTEEDGLTIEKELQKMDFIVSDSKVDEPSENHCENNRADVKGKSTVPKKRRQTKKAKSAERKEKETVQSEVEEPKETDTEHQDECAAADAVVDSLEQGKETMADNLRNMKPRYNRKCNVGSAVKKSADNTDEVKCMTIMSPSKMNANKRTLVEPESKRDKETTLPVAESDSLIGVGPSTNDTTNMSANKMTPDVFRPCANNLITANRNLTPMLETPLKGDLLLFPATPKVFTPFSDTVSPFTRMFIDQAGSCDLSSIPTPNFPMTPKVNFTPNSQGGGSGSYASRPTDYSNSSSYYQPSDNEQSQRLEQVLIQEAMKQETYTDNGTVTSTPAKHSPAIRKLEAGVKHVSYILEETPLPTCSAAAVAVKPSQLQTSPLVEADMKLLSTETQTCEQIRGNSVEPENATQSSIDSSQGSSASDSSTSSSSNCSSCESDSSNNDEEKPSCTETTVIHALERTEMHGDPLPERYSLRSNAKQTALSGKSNKDSDSSCESIKLFIPKKRLFRRINDSPPLRKIAEEPAVSHNCKSNVTKSHGSLLKELEKKRKRTISLFKTCEGKPKRTNLKAVKKACSADKVPAVKRGRGRPRKYPVKEQVPKEDIKPVRRKEKPNCILKKIISPRKAETIESVAARLMEKRKPDLRERTNLKVAADSMEPSARPVSQLRHRVFSPDNTSIDSCESDRTEKQTRVQYISSLEDEDFPRLHISSDEDDSSSPAMEMPGPSLATEQDPDILVKSLKARGIHLIAKKLVDKEAKTTGDGKTRVLETNESKSDEDIGKSVGDEKSSASTKLSENENEESTSKIKKIRIRSDVVLDKTEQFDLSKIELSQSTLTDTILGRAEKLNTSPRDSDEPQETSSIPLPAVEEPTVPQVENVEPHVKVLNSPKHISSKTAKDSSELLLEEEFHVKIITEDSPEYISIVHDETHKCERKLADYNLDAVLAKTISAKVYIEELDSDQDKQMVITPFTELLSIPGQRKRRILKKVGGGDGAAGKVQRKSAKPLELLYSELVDDSSGDDTARPNNQSKVESSGELETRLNATETSANAPKCADQKTSGKKESPSKAKPKTTVQKLEDGRESPEQQAGSSSENQLQKTKTVITLEQYQNKASKKKPDITCEPRTEMASTTTVDSHDESMAEQKEEDALMTFAVLGSDREVTVEAPAQDAKLKKRKATSTIDSSKQTSEKRSKPNDKQALLYATDLDNFLTKIHGPSP